MKLKRKMGLRAAQVRAHGRIAHEIKHGRLPKASSLRCFDCGTLATGHHHFRGYRRIYALIVLPLCTRCHGLRDGNPIAGRRLKTHCLNGHLLSGENLYPIRGGRSCKECQRRRWREYRKRKIEKGDWPNGQKR